MPVDEDHVRRIKRSVKLLGHIYPVLTTKSGELIDGRHRLAADPKWPKTALNVDDPLDAYVIHLRLHDLRREFGSGERRELVNKIAEELEKRGYKPGKIGPLIAKMTEYPLPTVDSWLEDRFKAKVGPAIKRELMAEIRDGELMPETREGGTPPPPAAEVPARRAGRPPKPTVVPCPWCSKPLAIMWRAKRLDKGE
jgi:hypothetical protein